MKCKNCGAEMFKMISLEKYPTTVYLCPKGSMVVVGYTGEIRCDNKQEAIENLKKKTGKLKRKCINCGAEMIKMVDMGRPPIAVYICPNKQIVMIEAWVGHVGNIYCDEKKETKKTTEKKEPQAGGFFR